MCLLLKFRGNLLSEAGNYLSCMLYAARVVPMHIGIWQSQTDGGCPCVYAHRFAAQTRCHPYYELKHTASTSMTLAIFNWGWY